jgi:alpha-beta hydrolase superfamily lysophospholipase
LAESAGPYTLEEFTAGDGYRWRYRRYLPPGEPHAEIVFIHGIQSHGGWYERSCAELAKSGFAVSFLDRRGSGLNSQNRGDAPSFRRLLDDLAEFLTQVPRSVNRANIPTGTAKLTKLPLFLTGISWGGKLVVALERRHPGLVDGLILLCPGFFPRVHPSIWQRLRIIWARLFRPRKLLPIPLNDPALFTPTPRWQEYLRHDPLRLHQATARLFIESVRLDRYLRHVPKYVHVPVLLLLAAEDRIIHNAKTRAFVERFATKDKQVIEYAGAHHTLEFEAEPDRFITDIKSWLFQRSNGTAP